MQGSVRRRERGRVEKSVERKSDVGERRGRAVTKGSAVCFIEAPCKHAIENAELCYRSESWAISGM